MLASAGCGRETVSPAIESQADPYEDAETSELLGMYGWDPESGFHNAVWSGTLVIDGPCAYLDVSHQDGKPVPEGEPLRSFVRLPEPLTRLNATGEVWVGEHGPMSSGDEVVLVGSEGWQRHWNQADEDTHVFEYVWSDPAGPAARRIPVCAAHVSLYAAAMSPSDSEGEESAVDLGQSTRLLGLFAWDNDQMAADYGLQGVLTIEPPCVYVGWEHRYFLRLPRPMVRFDPESNAIWVDEHGPMTTGDEVMTWGGGPIDSVFGSEPYEGTCTAQGEVFSPALAPRDETWIE